MFRFTIREIALLTATAGIGIAWWLDHSSQAGVIETWKGKAATAASRTEVLERLLENDHWKYSWEKGSVLKATRGGHEIYAPDSIPDRYYR